MLLDDLVQAIQTVQGRIREHGNTLSQNEYRTRLALIDPILNALGWDVSDPVLVTPEYQAGNGRADYALLGPDGKPRAFIEAKRLNEPLEAHQDQVFKYTWDQKVFYGGLTDGNRWVLEDVTAGFEDREGRLLNLTISKGTAHQSALKLLLLWHPTLASGEPVRADDPILITDPEPEPIIGPIRPNWVSLADYEVIAGEKPPLVRLPDKREIRLQYWYELLVETAKWLVKTGELTATNCPVANSRGGGLINTEPREQNGAPFRSHRQLDNGLFVKTHGSSVTIIGSTKILLNRFDKDPSSILLKPS